jgi:hypothetical protein
MATPFELEQQRQEELAQAEKKSAQADQKSVDTVTINNATPDDLKPKGLAKLSSLLFNLGSQIPQIILPSLQSLSQTYIPNIDVCPNEANLTQLINQRNNIVNSLNNIGININRISSLTTGVSNFLNTIIPLIKNIRNIKIITNQVLKAIPPGVPIPSQIPSLINDLADTSDFLRFKDDGTPKLPELKGSLNSAVLTISIIGTYVLQAKIALDIIDNYIKKCNENVTLESISKEINDLADSQFQASQTQNQITYQGFIIEIEEVPFTPTVTRKRALGKNQQGITLIQTELSFTTNNQTLINELKLIIDRDNLKAY